MNSVVLPFLMSMMLGKTIDLRTYKIDGEVFDPNEYKEIPINMVNSTFTILNENSFPYAYLGLPADLVLRLKTNHIGSASGSMGLDGLVKDTSIKSRLSVVIAVVTLAQTVHRDLKEDAPQIKDWTETVDPSNTHYVSSIIYGGWSVIFIKFECTSVEDQYVVRRILTENLGRTGLMNQETIERWNQANLKLKKSKELSGKLKVTTSRYSSVRVSPDLSTPSKLLELILSFKKNVGTLGRPLYVQMKPLGELDSRYPIIKENREVERELEMINEQLDDLKQTANNMRQWLAHSIVEFTEEQERTIADLFTNIRQCTKLYRDIAQEASAFGDKLRVTKLRAAIHMYRHGLQNQAPSYQMLFRRLKEDLDPQCTNHFGYRLKGVLEVAEEEKLHLGEVKNGLRDCRAKCIAEPRCRAIGFAEQYVVQEFQEGELIDMYKNNQCWIYFRSSNTAPLKRSKEQNIQVYNRNCY